MRNPNICRLIMNGIIIIGMIAFAGSAWVFGVDPIHPLTIGCGMIVLGGLVYGLITVRCPACGHILPLKGFWTSYCPHCGEYLD